jgi:solute:Na+ symporter, SSS family
LGNTDLTAQFGFWSGASLPIGLALCLLLTGLFFARPMNRMGLMTLPDFYRRKYGRSVEVLAALIMILSFSILLAGNLVAGGYLFQTFLGTSYAAGVLLLSLILLVYTLPGGLFSDVYTSLLQIGTAFLAAVALLVYIGANYGITIPAGMGPFAFEQLADPAAGAYVNWATLIALGLGDIVAIDFMQRVFAARNPETARRACFAGCIGTLAVGVPFAIVALSAGSVLESLGAKPGGDAILYTLLQEATPPLLIVLVLSGIVAASLSTGDGAILGVSAVSTRNVLGIREEEYVGSRDKLLLATRLAMIPITLLGIFFALRVPQTGILLTLAFDVVLAGLLAPLVLGLFWSKANTPAALAAIILGSGTRLAFFALSPTVYGVENTLMYLPNDMITAAFDGLPTLISLLVGLGAFVIMALSTQDTYAPAKVDHYGPPAPKIAEAGGEAS